MLDNTTLKLITSICIHPFHSFSYLFATMSAPISPPQPRTAEELEKLFLKACELQENDRQRDAITIYEELERFIPESPLLHYNMGLARYDLSEFSKAETHYLIAGRVNPEDPDIHFNQGLNYRRLDRIRDAITSFTQAIKLGDTSLDSIYNLALCHQDLGELEKAAKLYDIALNKNPEHIATLNNYAYLCHKSADLKKAEKLYRKLVQLNPNHEAAQHMLNALVGRRPDTAPLDYIKTIFDNYAENFEESLLKKLSYQAPMELWKQYNIFFPESNRVKCLDLGCGTGLAAEAFMPCCSNFTGVDLSDKILQVANSKNIYTKLVNNDIITFLEQDEDIYDLIIAADVFIYMGNLEALFKACFKQSTTNCVMCFSVETTEEESFSLKDSGRFGHSPSYIEKLCKQTGWTILTSHNSQLRQDRTEWILGHLFILQKTQNNH
jgi:predicted TPR repeat methyltransferase